MNLSLTVRVPTNASGFTHRYRFFSAEYETVCGVFNDMHVALLTSGASGIPADRNIAVGASAEPVSINNLTWESCTAQGCHSCPLGIGDLSGTGMDSVTGGGTGWLTASAPVVPGETIVLDLMVFDVSDNLTDSLVLLDGFEWTEVVDPDNDGDGLLDGVELALGTNPNVADTDGDGLDDGEEIYVHATDPSDPDTDGFSDGAEFSAGTDPLDTASFPGTAFVPALPWPAPILLAGLLVATGLLRFRRGAGVGDRECPRRSP